MNELNRKQIKFLDDLLWDERAMKDLLKDHGVKPAEWRKWKDEPAFAIKLQEVWEFLQVMREGDVHKGAAEAVRRSRKGANGDVRYLTVNHWRQCKLMMAAAMEQEKRSRGKGKKKVGSPLHPKYAQHAEQLLRRMEAFRKQAEDERKKADSPIAGEAPEYCQLKEVRGGR